MNTEAQLPPCPFCGSTDWDETSNGTANHSVFCLHCGAEGPSAKTEARARDAWNTRAKAALTEETADALRCVLGIVRRVGLAGGLSYPPQAQAKAVAHLESLLPIAVERK